MNVLVLGESCVDTFIYGSCDRIAPDAPVPVLIPLFEKTNSGMAGNTLENLRSLGVKCKMITNSEKLIKKRFVDQRTNHMIVRVDEGDKDVSRISKLQDIDFTQYDAVVVSDYDKGFLLIEDLQHIFKHSKLTFMDTKKIIGPWASGCDFIKVNEVEYHAAQRVNMNDLSSIKDRLIITLGGKGCQHIDTLHEVKEVPVKDNCGAGDTFLAGLVCEYLLSKDISSAIRFANTCATEVVQLRGVNTVTRKTDESRL